MSTPPETRHLVAWAMGTFHASALVLVFALALYTRGALAQILTSLNTAAGLGLFVVLWVTTFVATSRALAGLDILASAIDRRVFQLRALRWGALNGMAFLAIAGAVFIASGVVTALASGAPVGPFVFTLALAPIALVVAWAVGGVVGAILAGVDLLLFAIAGLSGEADGS